jgi:plastocyanin
MTGGRIALKLGGVALLALTIGTGGAAGRPSSSQQAVTVEMVTGTYEFRPAELTIAPGTTVTWLNVSGSHTTTSEGGVWDSVATLGQGQTFSFTFQDPGDYPYYCSPHRDRGMVGKIIVSSAGG